MALDVAQSRRAYAPGARVLIRDEEWIVRSVESTSSGGCALHVTGLSELVRGRNAIFLDEIDGVGSCAPRTRGWWTIPARATGAPASISRACCATRRPALHRPSRRHEPAPLPARPRPPGAGTAAPAHPHRDGVGLGKTLEVGILLSEVIARGRANGILVVALQSILRQFEEELWARFTIPLVRLDSVGIQRVQAKIPSNANPFHHFPRVIISVDTLKKDEKFRRYLEDTHWDVIVIDKCQHVAERGRSGRRKMARRATLARTCDALIMTSATPHDGKAESFASLMNLLEPTAVADPSNYGREDIQGLFVRRFKKDVMAQAGAQFRDRRVHLDRLQASPAEDAVFDTLESLEFRTVDRRGVAGDGILFRTTLLKSFLSSPTACAQTVEARLKHDRLQVDDADAGHDRSALSTLLEQVRSVTPERFRKLGRLFAWLGELGYAEGRCGDRVVIFSERIDTLKFLQQQIADRCKLRADSIGLFYGSLEDQKQQQLVHDFGTKDSHVRILLASDAASEGLNLHHYCHRLIHFDVPGSLIRMEQHNGRIDRYGQEETPDVRYLLTVPNDGDLKGDLRVLEVLVEKEDAAYRNIGDVAWLMQLHEAELEEARVAQAIQDHEAPERIVEEPAGEVDFLALLLGQPADGDDPPPAPEGPSHVDPFSLYADDLTWAREAIEEIADGDEVALTAPEWLDHAQGVLLYPPEDLLRRYALLPTELLRDRDDGLRLTVDRARVQDALRDAREREDGWPKWELFWPMHPWRSGWTTACWPASRGTRRRCCVCRAAWRRARWRSSSMASCRTAAASPSRRTGSESSVVQEPRIASRHCGRSPTPWAYVRGSPTRAAAE